MLGGKYNIGNRKSSPVKFCNMLDSQSEIWIEVILGENNNLNI